MYDIMTSYIKIFCTPEAEGSFYVTSSLLALVCYICFMRNAVRW